MKQRDSGGCPGAAPVIVADQLPDRLKLAEQIGAVPVDCSAGDTLAQIIDLIGGGGTATWMLSATSRTTRTAPSSRRSC